MITQVCKKCARELEVEEFLIARGKGGYVSEWCAACRGKSKTTNVEVRSVYRTESKKVPARDWLTPLNHVRSTEPKPALLREIENYRRRHADLSD